MELRECFEKNGFVFPDYNKPTIIDFIRLIYHYCGNTYKLTKNSNELKKYITNKKHILLIMCDGMGSELINLLPTNSIFKKNRVLDLQTVNPTSTGAVLTSIMTAEYPAIHGILGWYNYSRKHDISYYVLKFKDRIDDINLKEKNIKPEDIYVCDSIMNSLKRKTFAFYPNDIIDSEFSKYNLKNERVGYSNIVNAFNMYENNIIKNIDKETFTYLYIKDIDTISHNNGNYSSKVFDIVYELENQIKNLKDKNIQNLNIFVIADHGQINIKKDGDIILDFNKYNKFFYALPTIDYGTASYYIRNGKEEEFEYEFKKDFENRMFLFKTEEFFKNNIFGNEQVSDYMKNNIGEYISFTAKGYCFINSLHIQEHLGKIKGNHSGFSKEEFLIPLIVI